MITDHRFVGKREWGLFPSLDRPCQRLNDFEEPCGRRRVEHLLTPLSVEGTYDHDPVPSPQPVVVPVELDRYTALVLAAADGRAERERAQSWRRLANGYDDIRYALRTCDDTPAGHKEFYDECSKIIFPDQFPRESDDPAQSL